MSADYEVRGATAVITINNPPVNGLGHAVRTGIVNGLEKANNDETVKAIVITGAGRAFSGGADIREFNTPKSLAEPIGPQVMAKCEASGKPVIAAIHSVAMGGGLELALSCHYRVASSGALIALPEVKLGILPGAGGTQRLPRVVGVETAVEMVVYGTIKRSEQLADTKIFDRMIEGDLLTGAIRFAEEVAATRPLPKIRDIQINLPNHEEFFRSLKDQIAAEYKYLPAPHKCVECIVAAVTMPFDDGVKVERERFLALVQTPESKALRHSFFGERTAAKIADIPKTTPIRAIESAALIGAGTMGVGIAMCFAKANIPVAVLDLEQKALAKGLQEMRKTCDDWLNSGKITQSQYANTMRQVSWTLSYDELTNADIVIEAVSEEMGEKEKIFRKLDDVMKQGAIIGSSTDTLDINVMAGFTERPQDVIGTHFFNPAPMMRSLEVIRGDKTADDVVATVMKLAPKLGKIGIVSRVCDGFTGNRMLSQYLQQAAFLVEEGCLPEQVDSVIEDFGFTMGPFKMLDMVGNDLWQRILERRQAENPDLVYPHVLDLFHETERFGQKTSSGWYDYKQGEYQAYPSKFIKEMISRYSNQAGIQRRKISDEEIRERLVYALVNEAAHILEEDIAQRPSDIDILYINGYAFPLHHGGPLFYADTVGLSNVVAGMENYAKGLNGQFWEPAPLLRKKSAENQTFN